MLDQREARTPGEGEGICIVQGCMRDQRSTEREGGRRTPAGENLHQINRWFLLFDILATQVQMNNISETFRVAEEALVWAQ
jgi:hypothetical protein